MKSGWIVLSIGLVGCGRESLPQSPSRSIADHVPPLVQSAQRVGHLPASQPLQLNVVLRGQDPNGLSAYLDDLYNPQSTLFHQFLTPDAFHVRFDPSDEQVAAARSALQAAGFDVDEAAHGTFLQARANVATVEKALQTSLDQYDAGGMRFSAPSNNITLPPDLDAEAVVGLYQMPPVRPDAAVQVQAEASLDNAAMRQALQIPSTATGAGVVIGIFAMGGYDASDLSTNLTIGNGVNFTPDVRNVLVGGASGADDTSTDEESNLDVQTIVAIAPNANIRVYEVPDTSLNSTLVTALTEMASPTLGDKLMPRSINISYGFGESAWAQSDVQAINAVFQRLASQGQTVYCSSGDNASYADHLTPLAVGVSFPSSSPWVVAVGGTYLAVDNNGNYAGETTWYDSGSEGTGGGISSLFTIPSWQAALVNKASGGSTTMRNTPDIAADADPNSGIQFVSGGVFYQGGGTSMSAPEWTAFHGLVEQARAAAGLEPLGFAAPALYYLAGTTQYSTLFHDIADGSNNHTYKAVTGLDNCTGLGSYTPALLQTFASGYSQKAFGGAGWITATGAP